MMKQWTSVAVIALAVLSAGIWSSDVEAKRLGGGRSSGMQRDATPAAANAPVPARSAQPATASPAAAPATATAAAPGAAAVGAAAKPSWLGPVAGLAAGLGLAALASHLGFGQELASMLLIALGVIAVIVVFKLLFRRSAPPALAGAAGAPTGPLAGAGAAAAMPKLAAAPGLGGGADATPANSLIPADFDVAGFERNAKLNFLRLQAANDRGDFEDIREFTSPEMFAEIKLQLDERGPAAQQTDVVFLEAKVVEVTEEATRYIVSVHFGGLIREEKDSAAAPFDEIWHLTKAREGSHGWVIAGIQLVLQGNPA